MILRNTAKIICIDDDEDSSPTTSTSTPKEKEEENRLLLEFQSTACGIKGDVTLYASDINCLQPGEFLNDKIIDFWTSYVHLDGILPVDLKRIVVFSSLFYQSWVLYEKKLKSTRHQGTRTSSDLSFIKNTTFSWTKGIEDLFLKDFIFLPIPEDGHWILAVICYSSMVATSVISPEPTPSVQTRSGARRSRSPIRKASKDDFTKLENFLNRRIIRNSNVKPMIIIFDSFKSLGLDHKAIADSLRSFLETEWKERYGTQLSFSSTAIPLEVPDVPQQQNWYDCGNYVLHFFENFFRDFPISRSRHPPLPCLRNWFKSEDVEPKREVIYNKVHSLLEESHPDRVPYMPRLQINLVSEEKNPSTSCDTNNNEVVDETDISDDDDVYVPLLQGCRSPSPF